MPVYAVLNDGVKTVIERKEKEAHAMPILDAMGIRYAKPAAGPSIKRPAVQSEEKKPSPNTDRVQFSAPDRFLKENTEAADFAAEIKEKMLKQPAFAAAAHTADYRLMDAIRS